VVHRRYLPTSDVIIVHEHKLPITRPLNIAFDAIEPSIERVSKSLQGVFGQRPPYPTMADEERLVTADSR
jgi:hypothetical protein